jgi:CO/xanthine dehydrogenase FAD-binding subunit
MPGDRPVTGFDYQRPSSLADAFELLQGDEAVALAGGTDLLVNVRRRKVAPSVVVDLKSVAEIGRDIEIKGGHLRIGGRVVMSQISASDLVNAHFPALARSASVVGSIQIRNRATLAGNLCNASPAADTAPPLLAYSAIVVVANPTDRRIVPIEEFFTGPGETVLEPGDVVTSVDLPIPGHGVGSAFGRVTRIRGVDLASVNLACAVDTSGKARFGFGAVGPTPLVAESTVDELATDEGLEALLAVTSPISDVRAGAEYRRAMLRVHTRRTLAEAVRQTGEAT